MKHVVMAAAASLALIGLVPTLASAQIPTGNLLLNPGAEAGSTVDWTVITGGQYAVNGTDPEPSTSPGVDNGSFDPGINPLTGSFDFLGEAGGGGNGGPSGQLTQDVNLALAGITPTMVDTGDLLADVSFWEQGLAQGTPSDDARVALQFLDSSGDVLETVSTPYVDSHNGSWQNEAENFAIPDDTATIAYSMFFLRNVGSDLDGFVDDNSLIVSNSAATPEPGSMSLSAAAIIAGGAGLWRLRRRVRTMA